MPYQAHCSVHQESESELLVRVYRRSLKIHLTSLIFCRRLDILREKLTPRNRVQFERLEKVLDSIERLASSGTLAEVSCVHQRGDSPLTEYRKRSNRDSFLSVSSCFIMPCCRGSAEFRVDIRTSRELDIERNGSLTWKFYRSYWYKAPLFRWLNT